MVQSKLNNRVFAALIGVMAFSLVFADGLPEGYVQLPFIKASGNCHVKTGLVPANTDKVELTFELSTISGNQNLRACSRSRGTCGRSGRIAHRT